MFQLQSCSKSDGTVSNPARVKFIFRFDSTQARLNNIGQPAAIPAGNAAQSPLFNLMSAHYIELAPNALTALGSGEVAYRATETTAGGSNAIDFNQAAFARNNEVFFSIPVDSITPGTYEWLRVSLAYQNYDVRFNAGGFNNLTGTIASFIGFNTYIRNFFVKDSNVVINANKLQGFWAFETSIAGIGGAVLTGQAPAGATTVPNPLASTSPIPAGSCVVTGAFASPLVITGNETSDVNVIVSLSTNNSFEWRDNDSNGTYDPAVDQVVDMGIRGMIPSRL